MAETYEAETIFFWNDLSYCWFSHSFSLPPDLEVTEISEFSSEVSKKSLGEPLGRPPCPLMAHLALVVHYCKILLIFFCAFTSVQFLLTFFPHSFLSLHPVFPHHCRYAYEQTGFAGSSKAWYFSFQSRTFSFKSKEASSFHPVRLCALIMKDLSLWGDFVGKEEG